MAASDETDPEDADEPARPREDRPVLPYPSGLPPGGGEPLSRRKRWLVVLFFVPPLAYLALLVAWAWARR